VGTITLQSGYHYLAEWVPLPCRVGTITLQSGYHYLAEWVPLHCRVGTITLQSGYHYLAEWISLPCRVGTITLQSGYHYLAEWVPLPCRVGTITLFVPSSPKRTRCLTRKPDRAFTRDENRPSEWELPDFSPEKLRPRPLDNFFRQLFRISFRAIGVARVQK